MKKLILAAAIMAASGAASANVDFTIMGGYDSETLLNAAAEVGYGQAVVGIKGLGSIEEYQQSGQYEKTTKEGTTTLYGGYRLGNGMTLKAGAAWSTYSINLKNNGSTTLDESKSVIRPMIGLGYDLNENVTLDVHYTMSGSVDTAPGQSHTFSDSFSIMAGYRF